MCEKTGLTLWINGRKTVTSNKLDIGTDIEADTQIYPSSLYDLDDDVKKT